MLSPRLRVWSLLSNRARMRETQQMAIFQQPANLTLSFFSFRFKVIAPAEHSSVDVFHVFEAFVLQFKTGLIGTEPGLAVNSNLLTSV